MAVRHGGQHLPAAMPTATLSSHPSQWESGSLKCKKILAGVNGTRIGDGCPPWALHGGLHSLLLSFSLLTPAFPLCPEQPGWLSRPVAEIPVLPGPGESSAAVPSPRLPQDFLSGQSQGRQGGVPPDAPQPPALALPQEALPGARGGVGKGGERRKMGSHGGSRQIRLGWKRRADAAPGRGSDLRPGHFPRAARPEPLQEPRDEITAREIQHLSRGRAGSGNTRQTGGGKSLPEPAALGKMFPLLLALSDSRAGRAGHGQSPASPRGCGQGDIGPERCGGPGEAGLHVPQGLTLLPRHQQ